MPDIQLTGTVHHGRPVMYLDDLAEMFLKLAKRVEAAEADGNASPASALVAELGGYFHDAHLAHCKHSHLAAMHRDRYHTSVFDRFAPPV